MGVLLYNDFFDDHGQAWRVEIHRTGYSGTSLEIVCEKNALALNYKGPENNYGGIYTSNLNIPVQVTDSVRKAVVESVVFGHERLHYVELYKGPNLEWRGWIQVDFIRWQDLPFPYTVNLNFTDSLAKLQKVDYKAESAATVYSTFFEVLQFGLEDVGVNEIWGNSEAFVSTYVDWQANNALLTTFDWFIDTRYQRKVYEEKDSDGNVEYTTCSQILTDILVLFRSRLMLSGGKYCIQQIDALDTDDALRNDYDKVGGDVAINVIDNINHIVDNVNIFRVESPSTYNWYAGLKSAKFIYNTTQSENLIEGDDLFTGLNIYNLDDNENKARFDLYILVRTKTILINLDDWQHHFRLRFTNTEIDGPIDDIYYYVNYLGSVDYSSGYAITEEWRLESGYYTVIDSNAVYNAYSGQEVVSDIVIRINAPVRENGKEAHLRLEFEKTTDGQGNDITDETTVYTMSYEVLKQELYLLPDGTNKDIVDHIDYEIINDAPSNYSKSEEWESKFGDGPNLLSSSMLEVNLSAGWKETLYWKRNGESLNYALHELSLRSVMALYKSHVKGLDASIYPSLPFHYSLYENAERFVCVQMRHNLGTGICSGRWVFYQKNYIESGTVPPPTTGKGDGNNLPPISTGDDSNQLNGLVHITPDGSTIIGSLNGNMPYGSGNTQVGNTAFGVIEGENIYNYLLSDFSISINTLSFIAAHGLPIGIADYIYDGSAISGISSGNIYRINVIDALVIQFTDVRGTMLESGQGSDSFTLKDIADISNATAVGANAKPSKSNQVALGDDNIEEMKVGLMLMDVLNPAPGDRYIFKDDKMQLIATLYEAGECVKNYTPGFAIPNPAGYSPDEINQMFQIFLQGRKMIYGHIAGYNILDSGGGTFSFNFPKNRDNATLEIYYTAIY